MLFTECHYSLLFLSCLILATASFANQNSSCEPSSCGNIRNISYPFRLKDDPQYCGMSVYEISCENNTAASIYLHSYKYHVLAINYQNYTIRLADPTIKHTDTCSFPSYSPQWFNLTRIDGFPYSTISYKFGGDGNDVPTALPITFMSCPFPLNDFLFFETDTCVSVSSNRSVARHTYIKVGDLYAENVRDLCRIDLVVMTSSPSVYDGQKNDNLSLSQVHDSLLYGFELCWSGAYCFNKCIDYGYCSIEANGAVCRHSGCYKTFPLWDFRNEMVPPTTEKFPRISHLITRICMVKNKFLVLIVFCFIRVNALTSINVIFPSYTVLMIGTRIFIGLPFLIGILIYKFRTRHLSMFGTIEAFLQSQNINLMPIRYSYTDIKKMTKGFREKLGQGGYGSVYRGKLRSGSTVAVKVLTSNPNAINGLDFINEVATIGRIHHVNVVRLVGYCAERSKFALVYDFMPNGSLEKYIFNKGGSDQVLLSWDKKFDIAVGVARGIEYLHRGCDIQILHFDIKPHNILLDEKFTPKISDFGLAKFYSTEKNIVTLTAARGTIGYVAPELINRSIGGVSYKADVYSFGMLLLEIVGLKRDLVANDHNSSQYFPDWIYDRLNKGEDVEIGSLDQTDDGDDDCREKTTRMTIVALWCIQMSPDDRPSMSRVLEMLENKVQHLQIPPQPSALPQQSENQRLETYSTDSVALLWDESSRDQQVSV